MINSRSSEFNVQNSLKEVVVMCACNLSQGETEAENSHWLASPEPNPITVLVKWNTLTHKTRWMAPKEQRHPRLSSGLHVLLYIHASIAHTHTYMHTCVQKRIKIVKKTQWNITMLLLEWKKTKTPSNTDSNIEDVEFIYFWTMKE